MRRERAGSVRRAQADHGCRTACGAAAANTSAKTSVIMQGLDIFNASRQPPPTVRPDDPRPHRDAAPQPIKISPGAAAAAATRSKSGTLGGAQGGAGGAGESNWFLVKCLPLEMDDYHHGCSQARDHASTPCLHGCWWHGIRATKQEPRH